MISIFYKNRKVYFFNIFIFCFIFFNDLIALNTPEFYIYNESNLSIGVKVYPVSLIFNGLEKYDLLAENREEQSYNYINANQGNYYLNENEVLILNHDFNSTTSANAGAVGYGVYMVEISRNGFFDTCTVEWDYGFSNASYPFGTDLHIYFRNDKNDPRITFSWAGGTETRIDDNLINKKIQAWIQPGNGIRPKLFGDFTYDIQNPNASYPPDRDYNLYSVLPQDSRIDCNRLLYAPDGSQFSTSGNQDFGNNRFGTLTQNLTINKNVTTRNEATPLDITTYINVTSKTFLKLNSDITFHMLEPQILNQGFYTNLIIQDSASLILKNNAKIIVEKENKVTLKQSSKLTMLGHSEITIKIGAEFCNEGGYIRGPGKLIYDEKGIFPVCASVNDFVVEDSTKIVLLDSAELILPDSYTLKLTGKESSLNMNPNSKIKFGENSKLILEGGAGLIAKNAQFTSVDSTKTWDGIYLSDISIDTISGCKVINASGGLNMTNKSDPEETEFDYHTIIENCEFINKTNAEHYNSIFAYNSDKILIRNNHFYSPWYGIGFSNGIYVEYCTSYHFNILENEFDNCGMGISAVHSSPYIAGNDLDGTVSGGYGIFLDNSSSTLKYNRVTYFTYNLVALYSSPTLFKNIFENSDSYSLLLDAYSVPVMNPVIGTNITYWYAGDNKINVSPNSSGIYMTNESYPVLESGYNKFYLGDGDYYLSGDLAGSLKEIEARYNYWSPVPQGSYFDFEEDEVIYTPTEDGSSGNRSTNTVQLTDIGFGLSDTLYINDQSDNPAISNLIVEAKNYERVNNFADAVDSYKEIVSSYDTLYTAFSLHRILDCNEKAGFFSGNYQQAKDYFISVNNDTLQNAASRSLSKDLYRKVRFRNSELTPVEEDYTILYQNNINSSIGFHALLNKTIIANLIPDTTDNFSGAVTIGNVSDHKKKVFQIFENYTNPNGNATNALTGNNNLSSNYELIQNYPNPFNPTTKITYSIPVSGNISIKIYDLTGKVVKTLVNEFKNAGSYDVEFNGSGFSSGVYFYKLVATGRGGNNFVITKRMILLK